MPNSIQGLKLFMGNVTQLNRMLIDIPEKFVPAYKQIQSVMDQSIEQLRIESQVRIENFKREEGKKLKESMSKAQLENNALWTKFITVSKEHHCDNLDYQHAPKVEDSPQPSTSVKQSSFGLDESSISNLKNINLESEDLESPTEEAEGKELAIKL